MERIIVENVSKRFKIGFKKNQIFLARVINLFSGKEPKREINALKNVSFKVNSGEIVGIIGKNGSGKSTLLRVISGIYKQNGGLVKTSGKMIPLINLYIGLQPRLTMKDNIYLIGSLFGLSKKDINEKLESIIRFSELGEFADTKIYQFSEGMKQRIVFSIAINCNPEILLLDEIFEIGDENFRAKSSAKIKELVTEGSSVILVSHDLDLIRKHCDRVLWMDNGMILKYGATKEVIGAYLNEE
jgi:ABC-type polysaccharide/polyol phosphate transport system ATPase subunit